MHFQIKLYTIILISTLFFTACSKDKKEIIENARVSSKPAPKSLKLTLEKNSLNIETNTSLKVIATYQDNTTKDVTNQVEWIYTDKQTLDIKNNILKTLHKDTNIFLQAKYKNKTSNKVALEIYKEINGYKLPPMPDEDLNNATILGIDVNNNEVRDDVERWIFDKYKEPIVQAVALQNARAFSKILVDPSKAKEMKKFTSALIRCEIYYEYDSENKLKIDSHKESRPIILNTRERNRAYYEYNQALSGGVYSSGGGENYKDYCDFNETKILLGDWK